MRKLTLGAAALALTAAVGIGSATTASAATAPAATKASAQDAVWMKSNAQTDLAEIALGNLAMARSHNGYLLKVATVTKSDHETVLAKLKVLAKAEGVTLPTAPSAAQQKTAKALMALHGHHFNLAWDAVEIKGHKQSIAQTKTEIYRGSSWKVKGFAKNYLPAAEMHLQMAQELHRQLTCY